MLFSSVNPAAAPHPRLAELGDDSNHLLMVIRVKEALSQPLSKDQNMEDDTDSSMEPEDGMLLLQYQRDIKLETLARRDPSKGNTISKKGRKFATH